MRLERLSRASSDTWRSRWLRLPVLVTLGALALVACHPGSSGASLKDRAAKYWELKQAKRWEDVYDGYLDPEAKKKLTREAFLKRRLLAFDILSYEIGSIDDTGDSVVVSVANEVNFPLRSPTGEVQLIKKQVTTSETWVRRDGAWYVQLTE